MLIIEPADTRVVEIRRRGDRPHVAAEVRETRLGSDTDRASSLSGQLDRTRSLRHTAPENDLHAPRSDVLNWQAHDFEVITRQPTLAVAGQRPAGRWIEQQKLRAR